MSQTANMPNLISIHAPRAGSDREAGETECIDWHFNPRSPCGERLIHVKSSNIHF